MAERRRHAVVFEGAGGIQALVLQKQTPSFHIDVLGHGIIRLEDRLAFADGDLVGVLAEAQQLAKPPDAG